MISKKTQKKGKYFKDINIIDFNKVLFFLSFSGFDLCQWISHNDQMKAMKVNY